MLETPSVAGFRQLSAAELRTAVAEWLPKGGTHTEKIAAIESALRSVMGRSLRAAMAEWIVDGIVPVSRLVPEAYVKWRPPVRDAMMFVVARLSAARLAPKLLEQFELPENTPAETRLLRLIAKVPGLQKLGHSLVGPCVGPYCGLPVKSAQFLEPGFDLIPAGFVGAATRAVRRMQSEHG
jgi:hypothetical protein